MVIVTVDHGDIKHFRIQMFYKIQSCETGPNHYHTFKRVCAVISDIIFHKYALSV